MVFVGQMGQQLSITVHDVKKHFVGLYEKVGVNNRVDTAFGVKNRTK